MKKLLLMLAAVLLLACPAMAEEADLQMEANEAYLQVLMGTEEALCIRTEWEAGEYVPGETYSFQQMIISMTMLDMDDDGVTDVVLELMEPESYVILTYQDGRVLAAEVPYRGLMALKDDGTHMYASGADDNGVRRLLFASLDGEYVLMSGVLAGSIPGADGAPGILTVNGEMATPDVYEDFMTLQEEKLNAIWYDYCEEIILMLLT